MVKCELCKKKTPDLFMFLISEHDIKNINSNKDKYMIKCLLENNKLYICENCYNKLFIEDDLKPLSYMRLILWNK